ncbi:unnamed protein product [Chironomus riparius]|uniref:LITAF domain-containing protein n=1 Tax=Chironomus riparius TaxID=315576 RepID=A0A9N9WXZ6_9DIPT|nr:unnamed protein product [Chironomus riparius]
MDKRMLKNLGPEPELVLCPYCEQKIITKTSIKLLNSTKLFVCLMCLVITLAPLALVVYKESDRIVKHKCTSCKKTIGTYLLT